MSKISTTAQSNENANNAANSWSRANPTSNNPPPNVSADISSPQPAVSPQPGGADQNGNGVPVNGSGPVPIGGHSRKGSIMVGGGMDIKKGNLAFGTVDTPNPLLSSSPAAPAATGAHLADAVRSFGSIEADASSDPSVIKTRRQSTTPNAAPSPSEAPRKPDMHSYFRKAPTMSPPPNPAVLGPPNGTPHERRPSLTQPNGFNAGMMRPPQGMPQTRSPVPFTPQPQMSQAFRPQQMAPVRPNGMGQMPVRPMMMGQMQPGYQMMYQPGFYSPYNGYEQQYGMTPPQWAPQQHPQNQQQFTMPLSPRGAPASLPPPSQPSPSLHSANLPSSGGPSPLPTPPSRPPTVAQAPPAAVRPPFQPPTQAPSTPSNLAPSAISFTPRKSAAIAIKRPDGSAVEIPASAQKTSGPVTPEPERQEVAPLEQTPVKAAEPPKKRLPNIVRLETEEQRKIRLEEEARKQRIREQEEKEEAERKDRKERQAREDEEKKVKEDEERKVKEEEEKKKLEAAFAAEEAAKKKEQEEKEAIAAETQNKNEEEEAPKVEEVHQAAIEAREKADEQRQALLTPSGPSTPSSPLASPALPAGLPAKPLTALRPTPITIAPVSPDLSDDSPMPSALTTARPIEDLSSIVYPSAYKPPSPDLNIDAEPGKYRYDRDFLMQFMNVCKERPENLPPLEEIGLEAADSSSTFGSSRGGRSRSSMGPPARTPTGLGIGGINRPSFPQGMGSFGMGNFGPTSITRGTTSEERYNRSLAQARSGRTPSQQGSLPGLPGLSSRTGANRSQRGTRRQPQDHSQDPNLPPLVVSDNAWVKSRSAGNDERSPAYIERKVKALLNKLTEEKFDSISTQILEWANKSRFETDGMTLKLVIKQVFEKATDESHWSAMYAKLCHLLHEQLDKNITEKIDGKDVSGGMLFRKYLIGRCQVDFESGWKAREDTATAAAAKSQEDKERLAQNEENKDKDGEAGEAAMLSDEYYAAQKAKRRGLGLVQLIGELYKLSMISKGVIKTCLVRLLGNVTDPDEEDIESTCKLLTTVGKQLDSQAQGYMDVVFERLESVLKSANVSSRLKFMIMDIKDLRKGHWQSRKLQSGVTTIAAIHEEAAREQAEKAAAANRESISRGGSRAGYSRRDGPPAGEWQNVPSGNRPLQRAADFSNFGRIAQTGPTFTGPTSVFNKRKPGAPGPSTTPPLSRQASTTNMFGILNEAGAESAAAEETPQRPKLNLQPRTIPVADEPSNESGNAEPQSESMSQSTAETRVKANMQELWGEKDAGGSRNPDDIVHYFTALPEEWRPMLADRLISDVFRISKVRDAEVVGKGYSAALSQGVITLDVLTKSVETRMTSLDDDSIDFPQAYKAIATIVRAISLSQEVIDDLVGKVDVYGEPRITPKMKLDKALQELEQGA